VIRGFILLPPVKFNRRFFVIYNYTVHQMFLSLHFPAHQMNRSADHSRIYVYERSSLFGVQTNSQCCISLVFDPLSPRPSTIARLPDAPLGIYLCHPLPSLLSPSCLAEIVLLTGTAGHLSLLSLPLPLHLGCSPSPVQFPLGGL